MLAYYNVSCMVKIQELVQIDGLDNKFLQDEAYGIFIF